MLASGTGVGLCVIIVWSAILYKSSPHIIKHQIEQKYSYKRILSAAPDKIIAVAKVESSLSYPSQVNIDDSFAIQLTAHITNVVFFDPSGNEFHGKEIKASEVPEPYRSSVKVDLISFTLELPGMDYDKKRMLMSDGTAEWPIRPKSAGLFVGHLIPEAHTGSSGYLGIKVEPSTKDSLRIKVQVTDNPFKPSKMLSALVYFLGSLLTLPGVWAFYREIERWIAERKQRGQTKIILPK